MQKRNEYWSSWIKKARKELGMTQLELAIEFARRDGEKNLNNISKERVSKVEHGATTLSLPMYLEICQMLIEKRYQERANRAKANGKFYKTPLLLEGDWWDILKWYEEYEILSEQKRNIEAVQVAKEQVEIIKKKSQEKEKKEYLCDGQISFFALERTDREKVEILIRLLLDNGIEVPDDCKL